MSAGNESHSDRTTNQLRQQSPENETSFKDKEQVTCALRFAIEELYRDVETHSDVSCSPASTILFTYLYVVFLALEHSKDIKAT